MHRNHHYQTASHTGPMSGTSEDISNHNVRVIEVEQSALDNVNILNHPGLISPNLSILKGTDESQISYDYRPNEHQRQIEMRRYQLQKKGPI